MLISPARSERVSIASEPPSVSTTPELFIIESLELDDEKSSRQEGDIISRMLRLAGKTGTRYYYIRTEHELKEMIKLFNESNCRYLHISCHADGRNMSTTFDVISYSKLGTMLRPVLSGKRVFVSACQMASDTLAKELLIDSGCYSLIGPKKNIEFADAAAFWVAFYHLMFKVDYLRMKRATLRARVGELSTLYGEPINYFAKNAKRGYIRVEGPHGSRG
jgi:hypothetical protein